MLHCVVRHGAAWQQRGHQARWMAGTCSREPGLDGWHMQRGARVGWLAQATRPHSAVYLDDAQYSASLTSIVLHEGGDALDSLGKAEKEG